MPHPVASESSLDAVDYDPIDHLNAIFSHPSTLSSVSQTSNSLRAYQNGLDKEIADLVVHQGVSDNDSVKRIQAAKQDLAQLFEKIDGVQERAKQTESSITEMTADIKRLDNTKCNLTLSMTALKRLQMLTAAYEQLQGLSSTRQYRECAQLLQAVIQLMAHFKSYRSIDQIATLGRNVSDVQRILLEQVCEDFELTFAKCEVAQKRAMLAEACLVMDALGDNARSRLITWYCNTQLREYRQVFRGNDEAGSLDNISRRYAWFKRMLKNYEEYHAAIFPAYWRVDEILANTFCEGTRDDFRGILAKYGRRGDGQVLDVNLLLTCLQETIEFEHSLERKFSNTSRLSIDTFASADEKPQPFSHAISEAFEPYLSVWVDAQDKELSAMIPKYRSRPTKPQEEDFSPQMVIQSSTELFNFYRQTLAQSAKLSTGASLVELAKVFAKCLDQYAQQVLLYNISEKPSGTTPSRVPSTQDIILVLNTANYCYLTCNQLEEKMKSRIDEAHRDAVDLQSQADAFMGIVSAAIRSLVRKIEVKLEPSWREMRNVNWAKIQNVMDQSTYVAEVERIIKSEAADIVHMLHKQQYARAFCDNLVDQFANSFLANIAQCKPIAEVGAEQMLLDSQAFNRPFDDLILANAPAPSTAPAGYTKRVSQALSRASPLLKTLQIRPSPPESLVQAYLVHIADKSDTNFRKVLELKGIRRADQAHLVELFQAHRASPKHEALPQNSAWLTPLAVPGIGGGAAAVGVGGAASMVGAAAGGAAGTLSNAAALGAAGLPNLQARFDPASLGSALFTAAKDGVDRFGSPSISAAGSRTVSPPPGGAGTGSSEGVSGNVSQNLRNIGRFFKRDMGGLSGRFGGGRNEDTGR